MATVPKTAPQHTLAPKLDENIVDRLPARNSQQGLSEGTRRAYKAAVRHFNAFLADHQLPVTDEALKWYFREIQHQLRPATLNLRKYALLKCIKAQFGENNTLMHIAIEKVFQQIPTYQTDTIVRRDECLSEAAVEQMIAATQSVKTKLLIRFLFKTGCRVSEMINILHRDIKLINGICKIRILGKRNKERFVYAPADLIQEIHSVYDGHKYLFESPSGRPLHRVNVTNAIKKAGEKVGWNVSAHSLRHARATDMLVDKGVSLKAVSQHLGHSTTAITADMYIHDSVDYHQLFRRDAI